MKAQWLIPLVLCSACMHQDKKKPPKAMEEITATSAVGTWEIAAPNGQHATVVLESNGTGTRHFNSHSQDGAWEQMGEQIWIFWDNGWIDRISVEDGKTVSDSFGPGTALDAEPDHSSPARKIH